MTIEKNWRIAELIKKHLREEMTADERTELNNWVTESDANRQFFNRFEDKEYVAAELEAISRADTNATLNRTLSILGVEPAAAPAMAGKQSVARISWLRYAAAATVVLALATGGYFLLKGWHNSTAPVATTTAPAQDVPAGSNKAILTLADGSQVVLDSAANGQLAQQGKMNVIKQDGQLKYNSGKGADMSAVLYNMVQTPRGGQYQLVLQDGTEVWLNAASTLKYPAAFTGRERVVELTGEGYFEVAHRDHVPFKVIVPGGQEVEVLGTHFNIMAYKDEPQIRTTLLEGRVRVQSETGNQPSAVLSPGQQAQLSASGGIKVDKDADTEQALAWKNGLQSFKNAELPAIMRQVSRWYNVDVVYQGAAPSMGGLNATIPRSTSLQHLLHALELNNDQLHFKVEKVEKKTTVTVLP